MIKKLSYSILFLFFLQAVMAVGKDELLPTSFRHFTITEGLSQNVGSVIMQDRRGFIWMGTLEGLSRYDGKNFRTYRHDSFDPTSINSGEIKDIVQDREGNLWVATSKGLSRYRYQTDDFYNYFAENDSAGTLPDDRVNCLFVDKAGILWVGTQQGFCYFDTFSQSFINPLNKIHQATQWKDKRILSIHKTRENVLWVGTETGLLRVVLDGNVIQSFEEFKQPNAFFPAKITDIVSKGDSLYIGSNRGLLIYDDESKNFTSFSSSENREGSLSNNSIRDLFLSNLGHLYIATDHGLNLKLPGEDYFHKLFVSQQNKNSIISNSIRSVYVDSFGVLWIGTIGGVNKANNGQKKFHHLNLAEEKRENSFNTQNPTWDIVRTGEGTFWVGTSKKGLLRFKDGIRKGEFKEIKTFNTPKGTVEVTSVFSLEKDSNIIWVSSDKGLIHFNTTKNEAVLYDKYANDLYNSNPPLIISMALDGWGTLWLGTMDGLLYLPKDESLIRHMTHESTTSLCLRHKRIQTLFISDSNQFFIGTRDGLARMNLDELYNSNLLAEERVNRCMEYINYYLTDQLPLAIYEDDDGFWIGTVEGLYRYHSNIDSMERIDELAKEEHQIINSILLDEHGDLWFSGNYGIKRYHPVNRTLKVYDQSDGLQEIEYNANSMKKDEDGYLYFGGLKGITWFHPDSIHDNAIPPPVEITNFYLFNEEVDQGEQLTGSETVFPNSILETDKIKLKYNQNFIGFSFAALHYVNSSKNQFACRLEGLEDSLRYLGNRDYVFYTNLDPGTYHFHVYAANCDGIWNWEGDTITIIITPPFWQTWWFYGITSIAVLLALFVFIFLRERNLKHDKFRLEREVKMRTYEILSTKEELEESKSFVESIISNASAGIAVVDEKGIFTLVNNALCKMFNYQQDALTGMNYREITKDHVSDITEDLQKEIEENNTAYYEREFVRKDGTTFPAAIAVSMMESEEVGRAFTMLINDISERITAEEELQKYRNHLEQLVEERTKELKKEKERAQKADKMKSAFLANISHEVRTPLNAIVGFSQLLQTPDLENKQRLNFTNLIVQNSDALLQQFNDIIDLASLETGEVILQKEDVVLKEILLELFNKYEEFNNKSKKNINFVLNYDGLDKLGVLKTDKRRLYQILDNYLDNAFKFTEQGSVELACIIEEAKGCVLFKISDTGIGIAKDKLEMVFSQFSKVEDDDSKLFRGAGLGLALTKKIANLMHGTVWVESEPGKGSNFYLKLPFLFEKENTEIATSNKPNNMEANDKKTVLVAEDEENNFLFLEEVLHRMNMDVIWAKDGKEAIAIAVDKKPDLILMDIKMPIMNGYDAASTIKEMFPDIPIIAQTAYAMPDERTQILKAGCDDYLAKPIQVHDIMEKVKKHIS